MTPPARTCQKCGASFVPGPTQRRMFYCSPACRKTNAEKCRARYERNPEKYNAMSESYYQRNRETIRAQMRERFQETRLRAPWRNIMAGAKNRAKVGKFPFDLTEAWAASRWTGTCELSGITFQLGLKPSDVRMFAASIDRVDPAKGYTQDNCRFILFAINALKQDGTDEDVFAIVEAITRRHPRLFQ